MRTRTAGLSYEPAISTFLETNLDLSLSVSHFVFYGSEDDLMNPDNAVVALGALAQEHRLALFRLLVRAGENGLPAGAIAEALGVPNSSLSFHLSQLRKAGLILQERQHRSLIYRANYQAMNALMSYLLENCCAGEACGPTAECQPAQPERKSA